ncbi:hypothetical protein BJY16_005447 [Actinoplanes octamycinicus]|uniref:Uncharacterized protein n=1 Tax=Actinoplanes octamycinicus TaxID=135948 RepID=A0A7W7H132_9ACTN|nr:hypothetical protein [Actinoplanes octamycinicus]MBB4741988.1 hypothetical protein [Actinoplanes octamycinicus]GIE60751.1 hypothetical protein Aoc01nite_61530 [Actinoplanes octamycinicus]
MTTPRTPRQAAVALSGRALAVLAAAAGIFLLGNYMRSDGLCSPDETAVNALITALLVAVVGLAGVALSVLRRRYRGVRAAALGGWALTLLPAYLLLEVATRYVASVAPGCPT